MSFHGSYHCDDVEFLLKPINIKMIESCAEKERLIQHGERHYSEILTPEKLPSEQYRRLFYQALEMNQHRMAKDCLVLAGIVLERHSPHPTIVSLARAGTPIGAIIARILSTWTEKKTPHYSVSIIRDRGIDANAINHILAQGCMPESIAFIDGWTGKGVISQELTTAIDHYNLCHEVNINNGLYVLSDLAGTAQYAASGQDYLIPSSILNATISGLISRSILNEAIGPQDFHGCVMFNEFAQADISQWFIDHITTLALKIFAQEGMPKLTTPNRKALATQSRQFIAAEMARYNINDINLIKPGIGEATRVLLRRQAKLLLVKDPNTHSVTHLLELAKEKNIPVAIRQDLPYYAVSLIESKNDA